ncbi:hypothetical protein CEXT_53021 [Caerostris extrusa]|uniref:Uncharacterized protein n=1 Tax=Caerostris extrusa TaxID=172846 RepID=A0AAV4XYP0_CAEEX|nr:hypothetical protein CEXT_53021 [Caerostris extrusa]
MRCSSYYYWMSQQKRKRMIHHRNVIRINPPAVGVIELWQMEDIFHESFQLNWWDPPVIFTEHVFCFWKTPSDLDMVCWRFAQFEEQVTFKQTFTEVIYATPGSLKARIRMNCVGNHTWVLNGAVWQAMSKSGYFPETNTCSNLVNPTNSVKDSLHVSSSQVGFSEWKQCYPKHPVVEMSHEKTKFLFEIKNG